MNASPLPACIAPRDTPAQRRYPWRRRLLIAAVILAALPLTAALAFTAAVAWWPYPEALARPPAASPWLVDRAGKPLAAFVADDDQWQLPLTDSEISPYLLAALVAVEDRRFAAHHGVDWTAAAAALWQDLCAGRVVRGASTITMQLERLRDPRPRTFASKVIEAVRAEQIEQRLDKRTILVEYCNRAPFGGNLVGAGAASWRWFGVACKDLSLAQAALLAGLPQNPARLRPDRHPERATTRRDAVLAAMLATGAITDAQHAQAVAEPVIAGWRPLPQQHAGAPDAFGAAATLAGLAENATGTIATTLDAATQELACRLAQQQLTALGGGIDAAAAVVLDSANAEVLASVSLGGSDVDLVRAPRSTGSTLKPFIYAAAFAGGLCAPESLVDDLPAAWAGYAPANYDHVFRGRLTASEALAASRNLPALALLARLGVLPVIGLCDGLGLHHLARAPERYGVTLAIGGAEASPLEVAEAYAALARGGVARPARILRAADGAAAPRVLAESACWQVLHCLDEAERTRAVCAEAVRVGAAWKTGTSSGHRDAWCAAVTPQRTVVVWLGSSHGAGDAALVGHDAAAPLALRLLAALDPQGGGWPTVAATLVPPRAMIAPTPRLVLVSPSAGQEFIRDPAAPAERQRLPLAAAGGAAGQRWWFVDGTLIDSAPAGEQRWWSPTVGSHEVRVVDAAGHGAAARIIVK